MVQEAKKLMAADDDEEHHNANQGDDVGPKIKMGKIGKKKKKGGDTGATKATAETYTKKITTIDTGDTRHSGGGFNENDIEFMKKAIQILCQSTLPLGKSIDFVTDDVDSMSKEYEHWRKEAISCTQALVEQQKITEEVVQPLQNQLADLEERIREQQGKIHSIKATILRQDHTISNMLYSVIQTR